MFLPLGYYTAIQLLFHKGLKMNEKDFHNLIEQGNDGKKKKSLQVVQSRIEQDIVIENTNVGSNSAALLRSKKYIIPITSAFVLIIALILFLSLYDWGRKDNLFRFYSREDYSLVETDITLKEYSQQNTLDLLYFDWYADTEFCSDVIYKTNQSEEVICFREKIVDNDFENIIILYVVEKDVQIDFLTIYETACTSEYVSDTGVSLLWGGDATNVFATFILGDFRYYLQIDNIVGETEEILMYAETLIG